MSTSSPWPLAAVLRVDSTSLVGALERAAALGHRWVEIPALVDRPGEHLEALADTGLIVVCAILSGDLSGGSGQARRDNLRQLERQVADAGRLGATCAVLTPGPEHEAALVYLAEGCTLLARYAARRMVRLAVQPTPATCLADGPAALAWLHRVDEDNLGLALPESTPALARQAGSKLFHLHASAWAVPPLIEALAEIGYRGAIGVVNESGEQGTSVPC